MRVPSRGPIAAPAARTLCAAVAAGARGVRASRDLPPSTWLGAWGAVGLIAILFTLWTMRAVRRRGSRTAVVAAVAGVTVGLGVIAGLVQWVSDLLAVGSFAPVMDSVAVVAALVVPFATLLLIGAAAIAATRPAGSLGSRIATALRHPLRTWRSSDAHRSPVTVLAMIVVGLCAVVLARIAAVALILRTGWPFWAALPIASLFDAVLIGCSYLALASRRADRAPVGNVAGTTG